MPRWKSLSSSPRPITAARSLQPAGPAGFFSGAGCSIPPSRCCPPQDREGTTAGYCTAGGRAADNTALNCQDCIVLLNVLLLLFIFSYFEEILLLALHKGLVPYQIASAAKNNWAVLMGGGVKVQNFKNSQQMNHMCYRFEAFAKV